MDFGIAGSRPPSARRPSSRSRNPITGVEINSARDITRVPVQETRGQTPNQSRPRSRPEGVPSLNLAPVIGKDDIKEVPLELDHYKHHLNSPGTASTVSWGTPSSVSDRKRATEFHIGTQFDSARSDRGYVTPQRQKQPKPKQPTAWDKPPCPENLPPPSDRYKQKYKEYEQDVKHAYQTKGQVAEDQVAAKMAEMRLDLGGHDPDDDLDEPRDQLQKEWTANPYSKAHSLRRMDVEELEMIKKKNKLIETVLIDQLSRGVLCDPEQDALRTGREQHMPGMKRGAVRSLHNTKVATTASATENMLNRRLRFDARILSQNGRDAVRELMGFYFEMDHSITIYEYKMFGKTAKALPFIKRGRYRHIRGRRKGELYELRDILVGDTLFFNTQDQPLPESLLSREVVAFRISDLDEQAKQDLALEGVSRHQRREVLERLNMPVTKEEQDDLALLRRVQSATRKQLRRRGVKVLTGIGRMFRHNDSSGDGQLNKFELEKALLEYHVTVSQDEFDDLWCLLDSDNSGYLDYGEFMRGFFGEMPENRKELVRKAFTKVDTTRKGIVHISELAKFYKAHKHPKVISGELDEEEVTTSFLSAFSCGATRDHVSYSEFEEYYEGISLGLDEDQEFANILRNAWSV